MTRGVPLADYFFDRNTTASRRDFAWQSYRPVRTLGFRLIARAFGPRPLPYGVANLVLYDLAVVLVAALALFLVVDRAAALAAAALWALLSVHVEPVVYASALGDHLSLVLQLLAFFAAVRAVRTRRAWAAYALASLVAAALAMGAKEMAVTEGGLLFVAAALSWPGLAADARRRAVAVVAAHAALTLGFLVLRTRVIGAVGQGAITSLTLRIAARAIPIYLWKYLAVTLAPLGHAAAYAAVPLSRARAAVAWLGVAAVAVALWRLGRATLTFAVAWFALSLLPVLHVVPLLAYYADRFALVPSVGVALALGVAAQAAGPARRVVLVLVAALALCHAVAIPVEARAWHNELTLWQSAVDAQPDAALAQSNLGLSLLHAHRPAEALPHLEAARRISGGGPWLWLQTALADEALGRDADAEAALRASLAARELPEAHQLLARIYARRGDQAAAARERARAAALATPSP